MKFRHNTLFKDVYREVGLLEVLVTCLHRFATVMKLKMQQTSIVGKFCFHQLDSIKLAHSYHRNQLYLPDFSSKAVNTDRRFI